MSDFRVLAGIVPAFGLGDGLDEAADKGEKITIYSKGFVGISKIEGYMKQVNGRSGVSGAVEFYKKNARKHASVIDGYYSPFWMVVKGWGHPDPDSGWKEPEQTSSGVTVQHAKYSGASPLPVQDFLTGVGKSLKPWAMYKDKVLTVDDDVPRARKEEETMSRIIDRMNRLAEAAAKKAGEVKTAKVKRLTPKQLDKHIGATWSKVGHGVQVDIMDMSKIFKMATDAYGTTGTLDDVEAALKAAITKFAKNAKVQPSGGGPEKKMPESVEPELPDMGTSSTKYDMDRLRQLAGITSSFPKLPEKKK